MKRLFVICDGMADEEISSLGATPLESAETPAMDYLAAKGRSGLITTIPGGKYPGSENGILTILGYGKDELPAGRGYLEAIGLDIKLQPEEAAGRYILTEGKKMDLTRIRSLFPELSFHPFTDSGGLVAGSKKLLEALASDPRIKDYLTIWSVTSPSRLRPLTEIHKRNDNKHKISAPAVICFVPLLRGIAKATGAACLVPPGATGKDDTDYESIAREMNRALESHDFVVVHIEACDYLSHRLDPEGKVKAIENIDRYIIASALEKTAADDALAITVIPDHYSLSSKGSHCALPVPALLYYNNIEADATRCFCEKEAVFGSLKKLEDLYV